MWLTFLSSGYYRQMTQVTHGSISQMSINGEKASTLPVEGLTCGETPIKASEEVSHIWVTEGSVNQSLHFLPTVPSTR